MTTPDPRLSDRRSRDPKISSPSPKKYRKKGSLDPFAARTTCSEEMLATPFTALAAMRVKSGAPTPGGPDAGDGRAGGD